MGVSVLLYRLLPLAALLVLVNGISLSKRRDIDCRRYVYAPKCRGISAKRALQETTNFDDDLNPENMVDNYFLQEALSERKGDGELEKARLLQALLSMLQPSPVSYKHKPQPLRDSDVLGYLLARLPTQDQVSAN